MEGKGVKEEIKKVLDSFEGKRSELIPMLQAMQRKFGYLSEEGMREIASYVKLPDNKIYGVATFYSQFYFSPRGEHEIKVCFGTACHVKGSVNIMEAMERELGIKCGETTSDYKFSLERVNCVGTCALAPVVMVDDDVYGRMESKKVKEVLDKIGTKI